MGRHANKEDKGAKKRDRRRRRTRSRTPEVPEVKTEHHSRQSQKNLTRSGSRSSDRRKSKAERCSRRIQTRSRSRSPDELKCKAERRSRQNQTRSRSRSPDGPKRKAERHSRRSQTRSRSGSPDEPKRKAERRSRQNQTRSRSRSPDGPKRKGERRSRRSQTRSRSGSPDEPKRKVERRSRRSQTRSRSGSPDEPKRKVERRIRRNQTRSRTGSPDEPKRKAERRSRQNQTRRRSRSPDGPKRKAESHGGRNRSRSRSTEIRRERIAPPRSNDGSRSRSNERKRTCRRSNSRSRTSAVRTSESFTEKHPSCNSTPGDMLSCRSFDPEAPSPGIAPIVAKYYNEKEDGLESRQKSKIIFLRKFNNWAKSMNFNDAWFKLREQGEKRLVGLDLCCGKGGDLQKWDKSRRMKHVVFVDIAEISLNQCKQRYELLEEKYKRMEEDAVKRGYQFHPRRLFTAEFILMDCSKESLRSKLSKQDTRFDIVSCQFALHYSFESFQQAQQMLQNISENLVSDGLFIGTLPNSNRIIKRFRDSGGQAEFGNEVYKIKFESEEPFDLFGARYFFELKDSVSCPEFLVNFRLLQELAAIGDLHLLYRLPFDEFHRLHAANSEAAAQLQAMGALETYPPKNGKHLQFDKEKYEHAAKFIEDKKKENPESNTDEYTVSTISSVEWEAINLYLAFCFRKK